MMTRICCVALAIIMAFSLALSAQAPDKPVKSEEKDQHKCMCKPCFPHSAPVDVSKSIDDKTYKNRGATKKRTRGRLREKIMNIDKGVYRRGKI